MPLVTIIPYRFTPGGSEEPSGVLAYSIDVGASSTGKLDFDITGGLGSGDFTIDYWAYFTSIYDYYTPFSQSPRTTNSLEIGGWGDGRVTVYITGDVIQSPTGKMKINQWNHVSVERSGTTITLYINGIAEGSAVVSNNLSSSNCAFGYSRPINSQFMSGLLSDCRVVVGAAVHGGAFTLPAAPLSATPETEYLFYADDTNVIEANSNSFTPSSVSVSTEDPYGYKEYSALFDGNGDYLAKSISGGIGSGDFTIEMWIYPTNFYNWITFISNVRGANGFNFGTDGSNDFVFFSSNARQLEVVGALSLNTWQHVAVTREGTTLRGFLDGVLIDTGTSSENFSNSTFEIGRLSTQNTEYFPGYLSNVRIESTALYTANFSVPTTPLIATGNTLLLTCNKNRFIDQDSNLLTPAGNVKVTNFNPFV